MVRPCRSSSGAVLKAQSPVPPGVGTLLDEQARAVGDAAEPGPPGHPGHATRVCLGLPSAAVKGVGPVHICQPAVSAGLSLRALLPLQPLRPDALAPVQRIAILDHLEEPV